MAFLVNPRHLKLISVYSIRHALRGGSGLVFLLLTVLFGLMVANILITPVEQMIKEDRKRNPDREASAIVSDLAQAPVVRAAVEWVISPPEKKDPDARRAQEQSTTEWAQYLLTGRPAVLSAIFLVLLFGMPFVIPFGAYNQTAGDIGNRGLRYVLLRTERSNIYFGRFLGSTLFTIAVIAATITVIALYLALKVKIYETSDLATWSLLGFLALSLQALPYLALCAWLSASNDSPMVTLLILNLIIGGVLLAAFLAAKKWESAIYLKWLLPWGIQNDLLANSFLGTAIAGVACLGYTAVFLFLGHRKFATRDL